MFKLGSATSCVVVAEILLGHGKCPCWAHQPKGEQVLFQFSFYFSPARLKYIACAYGEEEEDPHLPPRDITGETAGEQGTDWATVGCEDHVVSR